MTIQTTTDSKPVGLLLAVLAAVVLAVALLLASTLTGPDKAVLKTAESPKTGVVELRSSGEAADKEAGDGKIGPLPRCEDGAPAQSSCWTPKEKLSA